MSFVSCKQEGEEATSEHGAGGCLAQRLLELLMLPFLLQTLTESTEYLGLLQPGAGKTLSTQSPLLPPHICCH